MRIEIWRDVGKDGTYSQYWKIKKERLWCQDNIYWRTIIISIGTRDIIIKLKKLTEPCKRCDGTGNELYMMYRTCSDCLGYGWIYIKEMKKW